MANMLRTIVLILTVAAIAQSQVPASWLDRPLANWNASAGPVQNVPKAPTGGEANAAVTNRCQLTPPRSTRGERAVDAAGWIPFWNVDQQLIREDVEIVGGMRGTDGMCRPTTYNLFVFVGGRFAGTLSPAPMTTARDGSSGIVRVSLPAISAEFARYTSTDPLCCPSSRVTVRYRIDRLSGGAVVVPVEVRTTR